MNTFEGGLNQDSSPERQLPNTYRNALNVVDNSDNGDLFKLTSEKGLSIFSSGLPFEGSVIGSTILNTDQIYFLVGQSTNYICTVSNSGIGSIKVQSTLLNFDIDHPIQAVAKVDFQGHRIVYFVDNKNPIRRVDLDSTTTFNINDTNLISSISLPIVKFTGFNESASGKLYTGIYEFVVRYLEEDLTPTGFGFISNPIPVVDDLRGVGRDKYDGAPFDTEVTNKTIKLTLSNLDISKNQIEVIVIRYIGAAQQIEIKSFYKGPVSGLSQTIEYTGTEATSDITLEELVIDPVSYITAKTITQKDNRLIVANLKGRQDGNLQTVANSILVTYGVVEEIYDETNQQYFSDYKGEEQTFNKKTYMSEEVYALSFQVIYKDGTKSFAYHIPAVAPQNTWINADNYASNYYIGYTPDQSTTQKFYPPVLQTQTDGIGNKTNLQLGTYLSQEGYPENQGYSTDGSFFNGAWCIKHHVIPPVDIEPHFRNDSGVQYIRYKCLNFSIPDFSLLANSEDIVGYVILRADRDLSNRSIQSQGIIQRTTRMKSVDLGVNPAPYPTGTEFHMEVPGFNNLFWITDGTSIGANGAAFIVDKNFQHVTGDDEGQRTFNLESYGTYDENVITFYSPDFILGNAEITGTILKEKLHIKGDTETIGSNFHFNDKFAENDENEFSFRIFCNYKQKVASSNVSFTIGASLNFSNVDQEPVSTYSLSSGRKVFEEFSTPHYTLEVSAPGTTKLYQDTINSITMALNMEPASFLDPNPSDEFDASFSPRVGDVLGSLPNERCLLNIQTRITKQYGNIGNLEYIPIAIIPDKTAIPAEYAVGGLIQCFNGDIFVSKVGLVNSSLINIQVNAKTQTGGRSSRDIDNFSPYKGFPVMCLSYFFVESTVNCNYRHRIKDGVPYYPKNTLLEVLGDGNPPLNAVHIAPDPKLGHAKGYNLLYSKNATLKKSLGKPFSFIAVSEYPNRIIYSNQAIESEQSDAYRIFLPNNFHDVPKNKGEIWNLFVWGNTLYAHCPKTLWRTFTNEATALTGGYDVGDVFLGNGGMFPRPSQEVLTINNGFAGTISQFAGIGTPTGYIFPDILQGKVFRLNQGLEEISSQGMYSYFVKNFKFYLDNTTNKYIDNPFNPASKGIMAGFDAHVDRYILTNIDNSLGNFTISYSFKVNKWRSFHTISPSVYIANNNKIYIIDNTQVPFIYELNTGPYLIYNSGVTSPLSITFVISGEGDTILSDNLVINSLCKNYNENSLIHQRTFDSINAYNDNQNTGLISIITNNSFNFNVAKNEVKCSEKKNEFRTTIPKNAVVNDSLNIFDTNNLITSLPLSDPKWLWRSRMKGKYVIITLTYNPTSSENNKFSVNYVSNSNRPYNI